MKHTINIFFSFIIFLFLSACAGSSSTYMYDDLYYSPNNDPVKQVKNDPRNEFNKTDNIQYDGSYPNRYDQNNSQQNPQALYDNRYVAAEQSENQNQNSGNVIINNNLSQENENSEIAYYDEDYASALDRLNRPIRSFNTYDPYQRDRILLLNDPFFYAPNAFGNFGYWDPFMPRTGFGIGWNSWSGLNVGIGIGGGWGFNNWGWNQWGWNQWNGFYDPFWNPWGPQAFWNSWSPYGNPYWTGFNQGFNQGYWTGQNFNNYFDNGSSSRSNYTIGRRGSKGSRVVTNNSSDRSINRQSSTPLNPNGRVKINSDHLDEMTRSRSRANSRYSSPTNSGNNEKSTATPDRYRTNSTRESYENSRRSTRLNPTTESNVNPSSGGVFTPEQKSIQNEPSRQNQYTRPRPNPYNESKRIAPQQNNVRTPTRRSTPSYNRSRPTYNSRPSYSTPQRSNGGSGGGSGSMSRSRRR